MANPHPLVAVLRICRCGGLVTLLLLAAPVLPAQANGLTPGTFVATTVGLSPPGWTRIPAADAVMSIDTFAGTATQLAITGFPSIPLEYPIGLLIENRYSFLLGSATLSATGIFTQGDIYRVTEQSGAWTASRLNTNSIGEAVFSIASIGNTIYFVTTSTASDGTVPDSKVWSVPRFGGTAALVADLSAAGAAGVGGAMVALGSTLHVFTFRSIPGLSGEHWTIFTGAASPTPVQVGTLPLSVRPGVSLNRGLGAFQAKWDAAEGVFVISGNFGDVLWRDPNGNDVRQRAPTTPLNTSSGSDFVLALAIDTDTGAVILGDKQAHIDQLRSPRSAFLPDQLTLPLPPQAWVNNLDYLPTTARYVVDGPLGCPQQNGQWPGSYINSRPTPGNAGFALTLESTAINAVAVIGLDNAIWGNALLPFDLTALGAPGCVLGTSPDILLAAVGPNANLPLPLPNLHATLFVQWAVLDGVNALGLVLSETRRIEIQ